MPTGDTLKRAFQTLFALAAMVVVGVVPASADGPLNRLTTIPIGSVAHDLDLKDGFLYVATGAGLTVVDLSTMLPRGSLPTSSANMGIKVRGQYAYLAGVTGGFRVVNISDPDAPLLVATRPAPYAYDVALKDNVAFVPSFAGELYVFDIEHPTNPVRHHVLGLPAWRTPGPDATGLHNLNTYVTAGNAKASGVIVKGSILITTDWAYGRIYYYDVSNELSPVFRGTHYAPYVLKVDVKVDVDPKRTVIFMLSAYGPASGIYTVPILSLSPDVSTAHATCSECGYIPSTIPFVGIDQGGLALGAGGAYLVYGGGRNTGEFNVVDVRNPLAMTNVATLPVGTHGVVVGQIMGARIEGDLAYFAAGLLGVQIYQFAGLSGAGGPPPPDTPPTILSFALNSGATSTANRDVTLNNTVSGAPFEYRASEAANFAGAAWTPYSAAPTFSMTGANGSKLVYFQVRNDDLDESTVVSDTITLSEPAPNVTAYALDGGANTTTDRTITLNHTASNKPLEYRASESATFADAVWLTYSPAPSFLLSQSNGTKRVYFQARNQAGPSTARSDTINLLEPAPVLGTFAINEGAGSTTSQTVTLNHVATGDTPPTAYRASESSTFAGAVWLPYTPEVPTFTLSPGTATKRVYLQLRNEAGVTSAVRSDTIVLYQ